MNTKVSLKVLFLFLIIAMLVSCSRNKSDKIIYGISPFQDTSMPKVAEGMGLYEQNNLNVELVSVAWEDVIPSIASGGRTIDIGIGSINLLLPRAENINVLGGGDVTFYFPLYVFKGASLMMNKELKIKTISDFLELYPDDRNRAMKIGLPQGTPYEQMLLAALKIAGMSPENDIDLRYVKLSDGLPAFLSGNLDIVGAGVTQRTEAMRYGHKIFIDMESLGFAEIIGIVTTKRFAEKHPSELKKLIYIWFESVEKLMSDVDKHSKHVLEYLSATASTRYTLEEYKRALNFQEFPTSIEKAKSLFADEKGKFYWKRTWDIVNSYLLDTGKIKKPIPYDYYWGDKIFKIIEE
jgi:ABC-type nitrate/sulfonate/bicarbonate transport system substrate-binding protein